MTPRFLLFPLFLMAAGCGGAHGAAPAPKPPGPVTPPWSDNDAAVPVSSDDPMWGDRDAPVTIVEFGDFQCHFCAKVEATLSTLKASYGPHKIRIVWKNLPLESIHPDARAAAEAAQGVFALAGSGGFWSFHDAAFRNPGGLSKEAFAAWAHAAGVSDVEAYQEALAHHAFTLKVADDVALANEIGLQGTPAFFINAVFIEGAARLSKFNTVVDAELAKGLAKIAAGTPKDRVYVALSQENRAHPPRDEVEEDDDEDTTTVWRVPESGPARGGKEPLVTLVEFGDFEDRFTRRAEATVSALRAKYGDDLRVVWRNEPLPHHARALHAAKLVALARADKGDDGFWAAHDALLSREPLDDATFADVAKAVGLDAAKAKDAVTGDDSSPAIDADLDVMDDFDAFSTPTFFIDGRRLVGAHPQKRFESIIDEELGKARALVAAGTPRAGVYEALLKDGKDPPPPEVREAAPAPDAPWRGSPTAKVVLEAFSDFQCPFCGRVEPTLAEVMKAYGARVKLVWRNLPLPMHSDAPLAAEAAMEAYAQKGPDGFWRMHDALFANQDDLKRATLDGYARDFGLDMGKWKQALDGGAHQAQIDADVKAAESARITGTPAFIVFAGDVAAGGKGYFIAGAHPYVRFRKTIERALAEAGK